MAYSPKVKNLVKNKHDLAKLLKKLEAASMDAVNVLVNTMNSDDESVTTKMKVDCAEILVNLQIKVSDTISKDSITRTIAEWKLSNGSHRLEDEGGRSTAPILNFHDVQHIPE